MAITFCQCGCGEVDEILSQRPNRESGRRSAVARQCFAGIWTDDDLRENMYFRRVSRSVVSLSRDGREWRNEAGALHREDGPALEYWNGDREWWLEGRVHRIEGPALVLADGSAGWYQDDELHRVDGPAIENTNGMQAWLFHGQLHRENGPALVNPDGTCEWYAHGEQLSQEQHRRLYFPRLTLVPVP